MNIQTKKFFGNLLGVAILIVAPGGFFVLAGMMLLKLRQRKIHAVQLQHDQSTL